MIHKVQVQRPLETHLSLSIQTKGEQGSLHEYSGPGKVAWICLSASSLSEFWYKNIGLNDLIATQIEHPVSTENHLEQFYIYMLSL